MLCRKRAWPHQKSTIKAPPQGGLEIPLSGRFFAQITLRYCLKFMFAPSLPNHAGCQINHSCNNAIFPSNSRFHALKYVICFPLWGPHQFPYLKNIFWNDIRGSNFSLATGMLGRKRLSNRERKTKFLGVTFRNEYIKF